MTGERENEREEPYPSAQMRRGDARREVGRAGKAVAQQSPGLYDVEELEHRPLFEKPSLRGARLYACLLAWRGWVGVIETV